MTSFARFVPALGSVLALATGLLAASDARAQSTGPTRTELELPETEQRPGENPTVRFERDGGLRPNCPFDEQPLTISLSGRDFRDARGGELAPELQAALAGIEVPTGEQRLSVVCDIRDAANEALRRGGWIATVQIPQQDLNNGGRLLLDVITARLTEIRISGDPGPYRSLLDQRLAPLLELDPLNERQAEQVLLNANDIPGVSLRMALAPAGGAPGDVVGNVSVSFQRVNAFFNLRNYNAKRIGRETAFARVEFYGLTGLADITHVAAQTTIDFSEQMIVQGGHEFGLGSRNIRVGTEVAYAKSKPSISNLALETDTILASVYASYPLVRTPQSAGDVSVGFDYIDQRSTVGGISLSKDSIRTAYARADVSGERRRDDLSPLVSFEAFVEVRKGLGILGATKFGTFDTAVTDGTPASRPFGNANAFVIRGGADGTLFLSETFDVRGRMEVQWTDDPLLNYDEYSIGNLSIGRGYDPGANSGDRAVGGSIEVGANLLNDAQKRLQAFGFFDMVQLQNLDFGTPDPRRTLKSVGGGLRFFFGEGLRAEVTYAKPLDPALFTDTDKPPARVLVSITTKIPALFR